MKVENPRTRLYKVNMETAFLKHIDSTIFPSEILICYTVHVSINYMFRITYRLIYVNNLGQKSFLNLLSF